MCREEKSLRAMRQKRKPLKIKFMKTLQLTAVLEKEDDGFVALCPELDIASQGDSVEEATDIRQSGLAKEKFMR